MFQRIVVTGGSGFLGRRLVRMLRRREFEVWPASRREGVDLRELSGAAHFLRQVRPDLVIHCAAHVGGIAYVREHGVDVYRDNLQIGMGLLEAMEAAGVRNLINIMPNCTYPGCKQVYREDEWWDGPPHPSVLMYALPRKMLWGLCWTLGGEDRLHSGHLILPNLYGPGDYFDPLRSHALGAIVARVVDAQQRGQRLITLWGTGNPIREWLYIEDAAQAICDYIPRFAQDDSQSENSPIYNVGVGEGVSIAELAEKVKTAAGWDGTFAFDPSHPDGADKKVLDGRRFHRLTEWKPALTLEEGIDRTVAWYRERVQGCRPGDSSTGFRVQGPGFRVQGPGFRVQDGCRTPCAAGVGD